MASSLPERPSLEWLRKAAKERLRALRAQDPAARLAQAQLLVAREHGFTSWAKMKQLVEGGEGGQGGVDRLLELVGAGRLDEVRDMLDAHPMLVNGVGAHPFWGGRPQPLHVAIETGRRPMIDLLLERGADVNGANDQYDHWSPLMLAMNRDRQDIRLELIRRGARVGLAEALMMGDDARVSVLLSNGLPQPAPNRGSWLALARTIAAIDALVAHGAGMEQPDHWGTRPIEALSKLGDAGRPLVRHLASLGATPSPADVARLGDATELRRLAEVDAQAVREDAVLLAAVSNRHHDLVRWLLSLGASANARERDQAHQTALHTAAWNGDLPMVKLLLEGGADPAALDDEYDAPPVGWAETSLEITGNEGCGDVVRFLGRGKTG